MTTSRGHQSDAGLSQTFDRVDFARRRMVEIVQASEIPDRAAVAKRLEKTASHCWCFWIAPQPELPALLISGEWNLSAFALFGMFERVEIWEADAQRAAVLERVAAEVDAKIRVYYCPPAQFADRLKTLREPYGLAAMQDSFGLIPRRSRSTRRATLRGLAAVTEAGGQCCVIGRNRFATFGKFRLLGSDQALPTPAEVSGGWTGQGRDIPEAIYFHPDHHEPIEVLFRTALLPAPLRKRTLMRLLEWTSVIELVLGAFAIFRPLQRGRLLIDQAISRWRGPNATVGSAAWRDCVIRENSMMFLTAALADGSEVIVRIPLVREAATALVRSDAARSDIARVVPEVSRLIPESRPLFGVHGWPVHLERKCRGVPVRMTLRDPKLRSTARAHVAEFVNRMCAATLERHAVDEAFVARHYRSKFRAISEVETELAQDLSIVESAAIGFAFGRSMATVRIHGDLTVNNIFVDPATNAITGLIDWETSLPASMPFDLIHYLIAECRELDPQPWGVLVARALAGKLFDAEAQKLLSAHLSKLGLEEHDLTPLLVAYWARGVSLRQALSGGRLAPSWRDQNLVGPLVSIRETLLASR